MNEKPDDKSNDKPDDKPDETITLTAGNNDADRRLDRILRKHFPAFPLSFISRLLREKKVLVNGTARDGGYRAAPGDVITVAKRMANAAQLPGPSSPGKTPPVLRIVYEDDDLLVVNKPKGLLTHGLLTYGEQSLASAVSAYLAGKIPSSLSFRPGPLHRLDRNTSGLVVFGKSLKGARFFTQATQDGLVTKHYLALVDGVVEKEACWEDSLVRNKTEKKTYAANQNAKKAVTRIRPLETRPGITSATLIEAEISSGKTHQIRAQCALHGHPLCGDKKYGGSFRPKGYYLHAYKITIEKDGETLRVEETTNLDRG